MKIFKNFKSLLLTLFLVVAMLVNLSGVVQAEEVENQNIDELLKTYMSLMEEPMGFESLVEFELGEGIVGLDAMTQTLLQNIGLRFKILVDAGGEKPNFSYELAALNTQNGEEAITLNAYNVQDKIVLDVPALFDKPILMSAESLQNSMKQFPMSTTPGQESGVPKFEVEDFTNWMKSTETMSEDIVTIFEENSVEGEETTEVKKASGLEEELTIRTKTVPADKFYPAFIKVLETVRENEAFMNFMDMMGKLSEVQEKGDFRAQFDNLLEYVSNPDNQTPVSATYQGYVDNEDQLRGFNVTLLNEETNETFNCESFFLNEGERYTTFTRFGETKPATNEVVEYFKLEADLTSADLTSVKEAVSGNFTLTVREAGEIVTGTLTDIVVVENEENPMNSMTLGTLDLEIKTVQKEYVVSQGAETTETTVDPEASEEAVAGTEDTEDEALDPEKYEVKEVLVEQLLGVKWEGFEEDGSNKYAVTVTPDKNMETQYIKTIVTPVFLDAAEIVIPTELPEDYVDAEDEAAMDSLVNTPEFQQRLMKVLSALGLMPETQPTE